MKSNGKTIFLVRDKLADFFCEGDIYYALSHREAKEQALALDKKWYPNRTLNSYMSCSTESIKGNKIYQELCDLPFE